jgi:hypothetical protein
MIDRLPHLPLKAEAGEAMQRPLNTLPSDGATKWAIGKLPLLAET